eukprot:768607-Hanusia_phi.AAC.2
MTWTAGARMLTRRLVPVTGRKENSFSPTPPRKACRLAHVGKIVDVVMTSNRKHARCNLHQVGTPYSPPLQALHRGDKSRYVLASAKDLQNNRFPESSTSQDSVSQLPFRPSSPTKSGQGSGSYYGCFGIWKNMKTTDKYDKVHVKSPDTSLKLLSSQNFLIRPPSKGGYGMVGLNIGGNPQGNVGEYKYYSEPASTRPSSAPSGSDTHMFSFTLDLTAL